MIDVIRIFNGEHDLRIPNLLEICLGLNLERSRIIVTLCTSPHTSLPDTSTPSVAMAILLHRSVQFSMNLQPNATLQLQQN